VPSVNRTYVQYYNYVMLCTEIHVSNPHSLGPVRVGGGGYGRSEMKYSIVNVLLALNYSRSVPEYKMIMS
jgi:hypothetical protein